MCVHQFVGNNIISQQYSVFFVVGTQSEEADPDEIQNQDHLSLVNSPLHELSFLVVDIHHRQCDQPVRNSNKTSETMKLLCKQTSNVYAYNCSRVYGISDLFCPLVYRMLSLLQSLDTIYS